MQPDKWESWLPLNEYSNKYKISVSTLRRRIRSETIRFQFEDGKYWLFDVPVPKHIKIKSEIKVETQVHVETQKLKEIKEAFVKVLQEKEEQILSLREEIADLRSLVKILEQENEKLKPMSFEALSTQDLFNNEV